jgi:hypothetical protein
VFEKVQGSSKSIPIYCFAGAQGQEVTEQEQEDMIRQAKQKHQPEEAEEEYWSEEEETTTSTSENALPSEKPETKRV